MATIITIQSGALTAQKTFTNDTKARAAMLEFYHVYNLGAPDLTSQQKLNLILDWIITQFVNVGVQGHIETRRPEIETEARNIYAFE